VKGNTKSHTRLGVVVVIASIHFVSCMAKASLVTWTVDSSASSVQLTIPDQVVNVTNIGNITVRMRDAGNNNAWTDAGGRRAAIQGTMLTDYADGTSIRFVSGGHNLSALEQVNLRPSPAEWDVAQTNYAGTGTAPAAFGARVRGTYLFLTFDVAFLAFRNVRLDVASEIVPITAGGFAGSQTRFGISSATADTDGLELPLSLGQPAPDLLGAQAPPMVDTNSAAGTIQNLGGSDRKLTYNISTPISIDLQGMILTGSAAGQIVAYGKILESPTLRIWRVGTDSVGVAWPASATSFLLEQNPTLSTTNWTTVTNSPVIVDIEKQVILPSSAGDSFYRLRGQ